MSDNKFGLSSLTIGKLKRWHLIPHLRSFQIMNNIKELKHFAQSDEKILFENLENLINHNYGYLLFQAIEKAKCELSNKDESKILYSDYGIIINENITKSEFETFIIDKVNQISDVVENLLHDANLKSNEINIVFLTGGSSYVPLIKQIFEDKFDKNKIRQSNAFTSVAYGLGLSFQ